ncbi:MAG: hypothetical protein ABR499_16480 [Gemmatimonadaceae bacterium]
MRFTDEQTMREWARRVQEFATRAEGLESGAVEPRPVIFMPLIPRRGRKAFAYVSDGARELAVGLTKGVELDEAAARLRELPEGLSLLCGDGRDVAAYERRLSRQPSRSG